MARKHYHLCQGLNGGYLPNTSEYHETKASAIASLRFWRDLFQDEEYLKLSGSIKSGYFSIMPIDASVYTLGEHLEIYPCQDDCETDGEYA
jgi:hypothetical protein